MLKISRISANLLLICFLGLIIVACKKDAANDDPITGNWAGTGISFRVNGNQVSNLSISYSGHATGIYCSFDYTATTTYQSNLQIVNNAFSSNSSQYNMKCTFKSSKSADITFNWSEYDSYCGASYSGNSTYTASFISSKKSLEVDPESLNNKDSSPETTIVKIYR